MSSSSSTSPVASAPPSYATSEGGLLAAIRQLAMQDWLLAVYHLILVVLVLRGERTQSFQAVLAQMTGLLIYFISAALLVRSGALARMFAFGAATEALLYRITAIGTLEGTYFSFREALPQINPSTLDHELHSLDVRLFGFEPALAWQDWVTPITTEWFSFFYFSYFLLISVHILPMVFLSRHVQRQAEFCFGIICVFALGHLTYSFVPGFGPFAALGHEFSRPLPSGFWHDLQLAVVQTGGAQKDIFPSIHTAVPTFLALFSFRHRAAKPFRYTWPIVGFFALNIALATMFLRWHYLIDVIAGVALASIAFVITTRGITWELSRRPELGMCPIWPRYRNSRRHFSKI